MSKIKDTCLTFSDLPNLLLLLVLKEDFDSNRFHSFPKLLLMHWWIATQSVFLTLGWWKSGFLSVNLLIIIQNQLKHAFNINWKTIFIQENLNFFDGFKKELPFLSKMFVEWTRAAQWNKKSLPYTHFQRMKFFDFYFFINRPKKEETLS